MSSKLIKCRFCSGLNDSKFGINLENIPSKAQKFSKNAFFAKKQITNCVFYTCKFCGLSQINAKPVSYYKEVHRSNNVSASIKRYRKKQFEYFFDKYKLSGKKIVEIGSGPGDNLEILKEFNVEVTGVEYSKSLPYKNSKQIRLFLESEKTIISSYLFDGFICFNYLEHLPNPLAFLRAIKNNLVPNAAGILEVPNFQMINRHGLLAEVMVDHLTYFTKKTLKNILEVSGFEVEKISENFNDYFLTAEVRASDNLLDKNIFQKNLELNIDSLNKMSHKGSKKTLAIWGAGHQANAFIKLCGIERNLAFICDSSPSKIGKYLPGTNMKIISPQIALSGITKDINLIVIAGGYTEEICQLIINKKIKKLKLFKLTHGKIKKVL